MTRMDVITREELYELVWSAPMVKVAAQFDVSGSYLARVCAALGVPRPERGYWAKLAVGRAPGRPSLPAPQPGDPVVWSRGDELPVASTPTQRPLPSLPSQPPARPVTGTHGLIRGAKELLLAGRKVDENEHLKPYKKLLVDVITSRSGIDKALAFANDLFNALESAGHRVVIAPAHAGLRRTRIHEKEAPQKKEARDDAYWYDRLWSPYRPTVVYVDSLAFGLTVIEMTESVVMRYVKGKYVRDSEYSPPKTSRHIDHTWTTTRDLPSGRLRLVVYSPYQSVTWSMPFQETKSLSMTAEIPKIVKAIASATGLLTEKLHEAERQAELWRQVRRAEEERRRKEEDSRRAAQSIEDSHAQLEQIIQSWSKAVSLEQFFRGVELRAQALPETERQQVLERLRLAREFVGTQDPLNFFRGWKTPTERYVPLSQRADPEEEFDDGDYV